MSSTPDSKSSAPPPVSDGPSVVGPASGETEPLVLSRGNLFLVVNRRGDIAPAGARDLGLFHEDTRHLSRLELGLSGGPPTVLSSETTGPAASQIDLTLTDREFGGFLDDPQNFLHVRRRQLLDGDLTERIAITNHLRRPIDVDLWLRLDVDFADIFEVRGVRRPSRGRLHPPRLSGERAVFSYSGKDGSEYRSVARFVPAPTRIEPDGTGARATFRLHFQPGETQLLELCLAPQRGPATDAVFRPFDERSAEVRASADQFLARATTIRCDNNRFEQMLHRALADIDSMRLTVDESPNADHPVTRPLSIVGAGIPWFAAPFGRDALVTALECLFVAPDLAVEALRTLAAFQGTKDDPWREEEPGKIMHELRRGELARAGEIPHSPYYGTIDATPLWLVLLGETWRWTGNDRLVEELWPNAERALAFIARRLERGGGFLTYQRQHEKGLENQGWKDSRDGVSFPDGRIAEPPIALIEVQGYVVAALDAVAALRAHRGDERGARALHEEAEAMRRRIEERFWVEETGYYALALDKDGTPVPCIASNPGHLLFCRAASGSRAATDEKRCGEPAATGADRASRIAEVLMGDAMFSGYGVRTLARGQSTYNPLSYHNGSVWPHDNALLAKGLAMVGRVECAERILDGLYAASLHFRDARLPELFCGLSRQGGDVLVKYPVSCSPQAWASGAFLLLLQSVLGLHADAPSGKLTIRNPRLPRFLGRLDLDGMRVGGALVSLHFERLGERTHVDLVDVAGDGRLKVNIEIG